MLPTLRTPYSKGRMCVVGDVSVSPYPAKEMV
jgi:hypothetical protein